MASIFSLIRKYEDDFTDKPVRVTEGYFFNQSETLKRINLYSAGQFLDGDTDDLGRKVFFDITTPVVRNFAKNIDLDTKDINFRATKGDYFKSWLYRRRAKTWMRDHEIAKKMNLIPEMVTGYGTVVVKKTNTPDVFRFVDLRNLACDPSAECLEDGWVSERLYFTPNELRDMVKAGWDSSEIDRAIADFSVNSKENYVGDPKATDQSYGDAQYICVHDFRGYVPKGMLDDSDSQESVLANFVVILPEGSSSNSSNKTTVKDRDGLTLFKGKLKELGYKEFHLRKIKGRWLGRGLYEESFPAQEMKNHQINWLISAMRISQLVIFQTRNKTVLSNLLSDTRNGNILKFSEGDGDALSRVDTQIKDNASSNMLATEVSQLLAALSNSYEVTTGANLPSNTPFSLGALMNQNANKLFDQIREDYGIFLTAVFEDWVMPELEKEMTKEGLLEITGKEDLEYVRENLVKGHVWDTVRQFLLRGTKPTVGQVQMIKDFVTSQLADKESLMIDIPKGFLDFEKDVEVIVTDERESPAMMESLKTIMQTVAQNPTVLQMPAFQRILDMVGMSAGDVMPTMKATEAPQPTAQPAPQPAPV